MVNQATEQIARQYTQAGLNKKEWGSLGYNAIVEGVIEGGVVDTTAQLQALVNKAIAAGRRTIFLPHITNGQYRVTALTGADQVDFVGDNSSFVGGYVGAIGDLGGATALEAEFTQHEIDTDAHPEMRKANKGQAKTVTLIARALEEIGITPKNALKVAKQAINDGTIKIALVGDSVSEEAAGDTNDQNDKYASRLRKSLVAALPGVTVTFENYALSSRRLSFFSDTNYLGLASEPSDKSTGFWRSWSTVGKSWRDHVKDFAPHLMILAFGLNDSGTAYSDYTFYSNLSAVKTYIDTWATVPSVVIGTPSLPSSDLTRTGPRTDILMSVARSARLFAQANNYVCADVNRLFTLMMYGYDDVSRGNASEFDFEGFSTSEWDGDKSSFSLVGTSLTPKSGVTNKFTRRLRAFYNGFINATIKPVLEGDAGIGRIEYRSSDMQNCALLVRPGNSGNAAVTLYINGSNVAGYTTATIPVGSNTSIRIEAYDNVHRVYVGGVLRINHTAYKVLMDGYVRIGGDGQAPIWSDLEIGYNDPLSGESIYTEVEMIGAHNDSAADGNGINHPTGKAHGLALLPAFNGLVRELSRTNGSIVQVINITRDLTIAGTQEVPIAGLIKRIKVIKAFGSVPTTQKTVHNATNARLTGTTASNCMYNSANDSTKPTFGTQFLRFSDSVGNDTYAYFNTGGFDEATNKITLTWTKQGAGATGTASVMLEIHADT